MNAHLGSTVRQGAPPPLGRRLLAPICVLGAAVGALAYVGMVDPGEPGHYPVCPLLQATGLYCPGCGGLRTAHAVVHGDLSGALGLNALAVMAFVAFGALMAVWFYRAVRAWPVTIPFRPVHWWLLGAVTLVFTVVRNLPLGTALAP